MVSIRTIRAAIKPASRWRLACLCQAPLFAARINRATTYRAAENRAWSSATVGIRSRIIAKVFASTAKQQALVCAQTKALKYVIRVAINSVATEAFSDDVVTGPAQRQPNLSNISGLAHRQRIFE